MKKCFSWSTILKEIQNLQNLRAITIMAVTLHESKMMKYKERISCTDSFVSSFFYYLTLWWLISANLGLNFNPGLFFFCSKAISPILLSLFYLEHPLNKLYTKRIKLNLLFKFSYQNSNFRPTLGFLYPALNNLALEQDDVYKNKLKFAKLGL